MTRMPSVGRPWTGDILTPEGFIRGVLSHEDGRITRISGDPIPQAQAGQSGLPIVLPGFIDLHVHGGGGADVMDGGDAATRLCRAHARHGTTSLLATTMTAERDELRTAFAAMVPLAQQRPTGAARILGVHLEGPYLNRDRLGAQPDCTRTLDLAEVDALSAQVPIRALTLAPEVPSHMDVIPELIQRGIRVQIGHSAGCYEDGVQALKQGAQSFTHLFNAMSGLHHRNPGMVGAALAHAQYAEIIPDLLHVHPGALRAALRAIPNLYCVSDATAATGMPDGEYPLGRQRVFKCMGGVRLADGTLAGSALTLDVALRNLLSLGLGLEDASRRLSVHAADYLGLADRGRLQTGAWADFVVLGSDLQLQQVSIEGELIELAHA